MKKTGMGIVGVESGALYVNDNATLYAVYQDGFIAEERLYSLRGRGLKVELVEVSMSWKKPRKRKKPITTPS